MTDRRKSFVGLPARPAGEKARITTALYNYVPEADGELALQRGKLVTLLSTEGNWWRGECQGEVRASGGRDRRRMMSGASHARTVWRVPALLCAQP